MTNKKNQSSWSLEWPSNSTARQWRPRTQFVSESQIGIFDSSLFASWLLNRGRISHFNTLKQCVRWAPFPKQRPELAGCAWSSQPSAHFSPAPHLLRLCSLFVSRSAVHCSFFARSPFVLCSFFSCLSCKLQPHQHHQQQTTKCLFPCQQLWRQHLKKKKEIGRLKLSARNHVSVCGTNRTGSE